MNDFMQGLTLSEVTFKILFIAFFVWFIKHVDKRETEFYSKIMKVLEEIKEIVNKNKD